MSAEYMVELVTTSHMIVRAASPAAACHRAEAIANAGRDQPTVRAVTATRVRRTPLRGEAARTLRAAPRTEPC